jgi:hypothetical protein
MPIFLSRALTLVKFKNIKDLFGKPSNVLCLGGLGRNRVSRVKLKRSVQFNRITDSLNILLSSKCFFSLLISYEVAEVKGNSMTSQKKILKSRR